MKFALSLKAKLLLLCSFMALIPVAVGGISYFGSNKISNGYEEVSNRVLPNVQMSNEMYLNFRNVRIGLRSLGLPGLTKEQAKEFVNRVEQSIGDYEELRREYISVPFLPGEDALWNEVDSTWSSFKLIGARVLKHYHSGTPEDFAAMNKIFLTECPDSAAKYSKAIDALVAFHKSYGEDSISRARTTAKNMSLFMAMAIIFGVAVGLGAGAFFASRLSNSIKRVSEELASGAHQVEDAAGQISNSSQSLAQASSEQAASLEETVATMEELTAMVKINSENSKQAASLALSTREVAVKGESEIQTLIQSIQAISADSKKIADITSVIDDIAFQTNLLALNASVEAARAGEQGKGFAVVAEAVRNLAQRSAESAKSITSLINESVERIEQGSSQANRGGIVLTEIVNAVKKVADLNSEMATASEEQSNGITQISKAMNQLDQTTQENAAISEEAAAAAEELSAQSQSLLRNVNALESVVSGESAEEASSAQSGRSQVFGSAEGAFARKVGI